MKTDNLKEKPKWKYKCDYCGVELKELPQSGCEICGCKVFQNRTK